MYSSGLKRGSAPILNQNPFFEMASSLRRQFMRQIFPDPIRDLPPADIPLDGVTAYLSQSDTHQILFMAFEKDVDLPEHAHADQVGIVLEGKIDLVIDGKHHSFTKGDRYHIPAGVKHSGKIYAGYSDITFFNEPDRYSTK
jgi:mannose-6-phosphate isomerase-like protein (cupin superfamily)